jgi:hypothetical protein
MKRDKDLLNCQGDKTESKDESTGGQEVTLGLLGSNRENRFPKTDARYWRDKVFKRSGDELHLRIRHGGTQFRWPLKTANRDQAAAKARDIYLSLVCHNLPLVLGWASSPPLTT